MADESKGINIYKDLIIVLIGLAVAAVVIRIMFDDANARKLAGLAAIAIAIQLPWFLGPQAKTALISKRTQIITGIANSLLAIVLATTAYYYVKYGWMQYLLIFGGFITFNVVWFILLPKTQNWK